MALISPGGAIVGLLTPAEAAKYLAVSQRTLRNYVRTGLFYVKVGQGHRRFRIEDLRAWVEGRLLQSSSKTPNTATSSNTASPPTDDASADPLVAEIEKRLRQKLSGSTPPRSRRSPSRKRTPPVVLSLRKT